MLSYLWTFFNMIRIKFYNWLNITGLESSSVAPYKWIYYTYLGNTYSLPIKKTTRGPAKEDHDMEEYFKNDPDILAELKGPFGDYHGKLSIIKKIYGLNTGVKKPANNAAEFWFNLSENELAKFIRDMGYPARAHISGSNYQIMLPPVGYDAGLGELGRMNYLISKKFDARIRLGAVTTDLPLIPDKPIYLGVQDFCEKCNKCAVNCPSGAIGKGEKNEIRGVEKWELNVEQCYRYWRILGTDCGLCMKVCPFSHPNNFVHNIIRMGIRNSAFARKVSVWGDDLIYGK